MAYMRIPTRTTAMSNETRARRIIIEYYGEGLRNFENLVDRILNLAQCLKMYM